VSIGHAFRFPEARWRERERARRLAWLSIVLLASAAALLAATLGQSEAMKTAWVTDVLSVIPPASLLVAMRFELRPPSKRFPFGYVRAIAVSFLVTASVLTIMGLWLFIDAALKLVHQARPPIGTTEMFGRQFWSGWAMMATLGYSMGVGMLLGKLKQPVSRKLHDKVLRSDAEMNRAEWMSEGAAIVGIGLVAFGLWWGDAAAAALISVGVIRDGWINVREVVADLMDESPTVMGEHALEDVPARVRAAAERLDWVRHAAVRLREQGHVLSGDVFVVPRDGIDGATLVERVARASEELRRVDWRLYSLTVMPVPRLEEHAPPRT
jgi:cation diffusion facilitator family transporter